MATKYRAYYKQDGGHLLRGSAYKLDSDDYISSASGVPLTPDNKTVDLKGWPDEYADSYDKGDVLVALQSAKPCR